MYNGMSMPKSCIAKDCLRFVWDEGLCKKHLHRKYKAVEERAKKLEQARSWRLAHKSRLKELHLRRRVSPKGRFASGRKSALRRGLEWELTYEEYETLIRSATCHYNCGNPLPTRGHGLDRIDNSVGYVAGNVLPCCAGCNRGRGEENSVEEWAAMIQVRTEMRKKNQQ